MHVNGPPGFSSARAKARSPDPEFAKVLLARLISREYARERAKQIDPKRAALSVRPGDPPLDSDTVYLCAVDGEGNQASDGEHLEAFSRGHLGRQAELDLLRYSAPLGLSE